MVDETQDPTQEIRPVSRRGKAKVNHEENSNTAEASSSREQQQAKEKKKPRKLERRSVVLEEPVVTLDTRVDRLERQFASLSSRVDAVEVRQVRRPTAATYRRSSSTSTRATSAARARPRGTTARHAGNHHHHHHHSTPRPSLADQLRESQRLRSQRHKTNEDTSIEEIPRSALTTTSQSRQVALTGQYNIPLPSTLSTEDILNIRTGLTAAGSIARSLAGALTAPSNRDGGTSGTASTTTASSGAGASRSNGPAASARTTDSAGDRQEQTSVRQHVDEDKENEFAGKAASSAGVSGAAGNAQPEERDVLGAENASRSWRNLILQAGGVVASAAKDAAVEFSTLQNDPHPANAHGNDFASGSTDRSSSTRVGKMTATRRRTTSSSVRSETGDSASTASTRRRPKVSRTSSRASSRV